MNNELKCDFKNVFAPMCSRTNWTSRHYFGHFSYVLWWDGRKREKVPTIIKVHFLQRLVLSDLIQIFSKNFSHSIFLWAKKIKQYCKKSIFTINTKCKIKLVVKKSNSTIHNAALISLGLILNKAHNTLLYRFFKIGISVREFKQNYVLITPFLSY